MTDPCFSTILSRARIAAIYRGRTVADATVSQRSFRETMGNRSTTIKPVEPATSKIARSGGERRPDAMLVTIVSSTMVTAAAFACGRTARCLCQSWSSGPNRRDRSSRLCSTGEDRTKKKLVSSRNGVVGSTGRNAPRIARTRNPNPSAIYAVRRTPVTTSGREKGGASVAAEIACRSCEQFIGHLWERDLRESGIRNYRNSPGDQATNAKK